MYKLREQLEYLKNNHGLMGIKGGTEIEAMSFDELKIMREISLDLVPMTVKIGGAEARNDISFMSSIGVDQILAPMIESSYALKNFVSTIDNMDIPPIKLAINMETITAYKNIEYIFYSEHFAFINQVTVGRSDLSYSMGLTVDHPRVIEISKKIVDMSKTLNKKTSVGGQIVPNNAYLVKEKINPHYINTRHILINRESNYIQNDIIKALEWEKDFYIYLTEVFPLRTRFYSERIKSVKKRLLKRTNIHTNDLSKTLG